MGGRAAAGGSLGFGSVRTARLMLSRPVPSDLEAVHAIHSDPATTRYSSARLDVDRAASKRRLAALIDHWEAYDFGCWAVRLLDGEAVDQEGVVGFCGIQHHTWLDRPVLNLYYRVRPAAWGRGIAAEAARQAVTLGRRHWPALPLLAITSADNVPAQRAALAAGLIRCPDLDRVDEQGHAVTFASLPAEGGLESAESATTREM